MINKGLIAAICFSLVTVAEIFPQEGLTKRSIEAFHTMEVNDGLVVFITQSTENSISAKEDLLNKLSYNVSNGKLKISQGEAGPNSKIYFTVNELKKINANGIAEVNSANEIKSETLSLVATGASKANILFEGSSLNIEGSGASEIRVGGSCDDLRLDLSGISSLRAFKLKLSTAKVDMNGNSTANINGAGAVINGEVSGVSNLNYTGEPNVMNVIATGVAKVSKSNGLEIETGDTTKLAFGRKKIIIYDKGDEVSVEAEIDGHNKNVPEGKKKRANVTYVQSIWEGFELGINGFMTNQQSIGMPDSLRGFDLNYSKAIAVNINPYEYDLRLIRNNLFLVTGVGFEINNYRFNSNMRMLPNTRPLQTVLEDSLPYAKNKLTTVFVNVPLYLSFRSPKFRNGQQLSISPGVTAGWLIRSYQKRVLDDDGKNKVRTRDDFNLQPFRFNASVRLSYANFTAFANYSLNEMFYKGRGPELYPFTVGVRIVGFDY
jgi:hypothetical protein